MLSRFECAIFYFSLAISLDPYFAIAYFCRACCYQSSGDSFQASLDFTSTLDVIIFYSIIYYLDEY